MIESLVSTFGAISIFVLIWWLARRGRRYEAAKKKTIQVTVRSEAVKDRRASSAAFPVKVAAEITYVDAMGRQSARRILTQQVIPLNGDAEIYAYCYLRREMRSFMVSRVRSFINLETGEIISDVFRHLREERDGAK